MPQSLAKILVHAVFPTMERRSFSSQEEHHRKVSFQDEVRQWLRRDEIDFDERYLWD